MSVISIQMMSDVVISNYLINELNQSRQYNMLFLNGLGVANSNQMLVIT